MGKIELTLRLGNFSFLVSQASDLNHGHDLRLEKRETKTMNMKSEGLFFQRICLKASAGIRPMVWKGESQDVRRASSLSFIPRALASTFVAFPKTQKFPSLNHLILKPHLEHNEDLTSSGVVPLAVLKEPGVGEQVISISTTVQTHQPYNATTKSMRLFCWDTGNRTSTMCNEEESPSENQYIYH